MNENIKIEKDFDRPWGGFIKFIDNHSCTVKIIHVDKGELLSLQRHKMREEFWYLISGKMKVTIGKDMDNLEEKILNEGDYVFIGKRFIHRAEGIEGAKFLEIATGKFEESDIVRIEDKYSR